MRRRLWYLLERCDCAVVVVLSLVMCGSGLKALASQARPKPSSEAWWSSELGLDICKASGPGLSPI